jgi:hypothetical protein
MHAMVFMTFSPSLGIVEVHGAGPLFGYFGCAVRGALLPVRPFYLVRLFDMRDPAYDATC